MPVTAAPTEPRARLAAGRQAAGLFVAAGVLTIVNNHIPPVGNLNRPVLYGVGGAAVAVGALTWALPWHRWPSGATLALVPVGLALIAVADALGGVSAYSYAVYFVVVFVWVGVTQPPGTSLWVAPLAAAAYVLPSVLGPRPPEAALSATVTIPVGLLVGEVIARASARIRRSQAESEGRAQTFGIIARAARTMNHLDPDLVLRTVVDSAVQLGFEAAEICLFDEGAGVYRAVHPRNLPEHYLRSPQPIGSGIAGQVRARGHTIVTESYATLPGGVPELQRAGYQTVVGSPVWSAGELVGALIAGTREQRTLQPHEVEAFELLASVTGQAFENATRFEAEQQTVRRLADLERMKREFLSNVSHELRTPLSVVMGVGLTLEQHWDRAPPEVRQDLLRRLNANAKCLEDVVSNLLDAAALESGGLQYRPELVDLGDLVEATCSRLASLFVRHRLACRREPGLLVRADPLLVERVVENLLTNAAKYTPPGTEVEVSATRQGRSARVCVQDRGPGIPPQELPRLGERFFRGEGARRGGARGTGLGLALVREILGLHGSSLEVDSHPGRGSAFAFRLPLLTPVRMVPPMGADDSRVPEGAGGVRASP